MDKSINIKTYDSTETIHYQQLNKSSIIKPDISIIIRCKNEEAKIDECLSKIFNQKTNYKYEVIVIDSGSEDNTISIAQKYNTNIYSIPSSEFNFGSSIQLGVELSEGNYCVFLSAHCIPYNNCWLEELVSKFDENTAAVYGKQTYYEDTFFIEKEALDNTFGNINKTQCWNNKYKSFSDYKDAICFSNANSCIRKDVASDIKFKNLIASEDREWALRVIKNGYNIKYNSDSCVYHAHNETKEKYYKRILINSQALFEFAGVSINIFSIIPLYLFKIIKDILYMIKKGCLSIGNIKMSITYRWLYVMAHYIGTRK